jgi:alanine racemase
MAVIKANAYGHGMLAVAQYLSHVDSFAVARLQEAQYLRAAGIEKPIVLLAGVSSAEELQQSTQSGIEIVVHCREQVDLLATHAGVPATVWLKIDTGMNRLGFKPDEAATLISILGDMASVAELRLMTHLANADDIGSQSTQEQLDSFSAVIKGSGAAVSIANTPAMLGWPAIENAPEDFQFTGDHWIRPGIALFGVSPYDDRSAAELGLKPVMQFEARLIARKPLAAGSRVGYKGRYTSDADTTLGIIAAGYGDGYSRHFRDGTPVLINGRKVPLIGNVSMDMIAVDLGANAQDAVGDIATLWGDGLPVEELAPWADAIPYELVCGVTNREASEVVL